MLNFHGRNRIVESFRIFSELNGRFSHRIVTKPATTHLKLDGIRNCQRAKWAIQSSHCDWTSDQLSQTERINVLARGAHPITEAK